MAAKIISNSLLIVVLAAAQIALVSGLPAWLANLNLLLVVLLFVLSFGGLELALGWAVGAGALLEIFYFLPFGAYLISFSLAVMAANFLMNYFFTNRSLYSFLALTASATVIYRLAVYAVVFIFDKSGGALLSGGNFWLSLFKQLGLNLALTLIIFYLIHFLSRSFKPVFLVKNKS